VAYCTDTDISSEFKAITFSSTSAVTDTEVDGFIDQASATIDGIIASKYEVPVTGSASLLVLKMICIWIVKARILSILSVKTPQDKTKQDPDGPTLLKQAMDMLKAIKKGDLILTDATASSSDDGMSSFLMNEEITYDNQVGVDNW
jgi:phage gp36-like protein